MTSVVTFSWNSVRVRADRLLQIVHLLRRHGRLSSAELARRLEVTKRTVLRDMEALSTAGIPVYAEHGRGGGFALVPGYEPDIEQLTSEEARALFVAGGRGTAEALGLGASFCSALHKLASALPDDEHRMVTHVRERIVLDTGGWHRDPAALDALADVQAAVLDDERIRIRYQSKEAAAPGERTVDPWGLLQVGTTWYLIGAHRGRPRSYRISRISAVRRLGTPAARPPDLDLRKVWERMRADFRAVPGTDIVLRIHRPRLPMVLRALSVTMLEEPRPAPGEPDVFRVRVRSLRAAAAMLVGFGAEVEVIAPDALCAEIIEIAEDARAHHRRRLGDTAAPAGGDTGTLPAIDSSAASPVC
ncbi:helix-turn-helix transcriptional regulator [Nocardia carnea]|uniref:helix-turn-helix transcriptional regulator n=1 Tax=Nocardia carnea TaxID=37328 RepID=UPI00245807AA|nr:YafY family protein [Nocardia carnea]